MGKNNLSVFVDNGTGHILTARMTPHLLERGCRLYGAPNGCDVQLCFVRRGVQTNLPVIVRINGILYDSDTPWKARNEGISQTHKIAQAVIYQSEYSRRLCEALLDKRNPRASSHVIHNGIEPGWSGPFEEHDGINITVFSKWRRHKRLKEIIELFLAYSKVVPNSHLHIFGLLHDNKPIKHPGITYYGMVEREKMFAVLRKTDLSIHLSKRDSFPNSVLETISAGIPVITTNNCGGATEACRMTPGCVVVDGDGSYDDLKPVPHYRDSWNVLPDGVSKGVLAAMHDITLDKRRVILPEDLYASTVADKYLQVLRSVV